MAKSSRTLARPITTFLVLYDVWRRLPPRQRRWVLSQARRHGPRIARQVMAGRRGPKS
jgi:hypothetical protein